MHIIIRRLLFVLLLTLILGNPPAGWAGWRYQELTSTHVGKSKTASRQKATISWQGMKLRRDNSDGTVEIFRLDQDLYWQLDPAGKIYRQLPLVPVAQGTGELPRELDEALAQLSPEERQLLEKYLPSRAVSQRVEAVQVVPGTETQTISGYSCQKIKARYRNLHATLWVTNEIVVAPEEQAFYRELARRTVRREGMEDWYLWAEVLSQVGGFAIKQENLLESAAGTVKTVIVVENLEQRALPETIFQLPSGFSQLD
jgi:hypothetical protein